jgi:hypothetical protein
MRSPVLDSPREAALTRRDFFWRRHARWQLEVCMTNQNGSILFEPAFTILPVCNRPYPRQIGVVNVPQATVHKAFAGEF